MLGATKWCVFRAPPQGDLSHAFVEDAVRERIKRMRGTPDQGGSGRVDLLQASKTFGYPRLDGALVMHLSGSRGFFELWGLRWDM